VFVGKGNQGWADKRVFDTLIRSAFNSATSQGVADNFHPHATGASFRTQSIHLSYGDTAGIRNNSGKSALCSLLDFSDNRFLVFESYCHKFSPQLCQR
jgi:hypothetical protein